MTVVTTSCQKNLSHDLVLLKSIYQSQVINKQKKEKELHMITTIGQLYRN